MRSLYFFIILMSIFIVGCSNSNEVSLEDCKLIDITSTPLVQTFTL